MRYSIYSAAGNSTINLLLFASFIAIVSCSTLRSLDSWLDTVLTGTHSLPSHKFSRCTGMSVSCHSNIPYILFLEAEVSTKHIADAKEIFRSKDLHSFTDFQEVVYMKHGDTSFLLGDWGLKEGVAAKISKAIRDSDNYVARIDANVVESSFPNSQTDSHLSVITARLLYKALGTNRGGLDGESVASNLPVQQPSSSLTQSSELPLPSSTSIDTSSSSRTSQTSATAIDTVTVPADLAQRGGATTSWAAADAVIASSDLTTIGGISNALNKGVAFMESHSNGASLSQEALHENRRVVAQVLDAIPVFIGSDDGSIERMQALGAPETKVIENLKKIVDILLIAVISPSEPSYSLSMLPKTFIAMQKMMRYDVSDFKTACNKNVKLFGRIGAIEILVETLGTYLELEPAQYQEKDAILIVLTECCNAIRAIIISDDDNVKYGAVIGSMEVLVGVLQRHAWSNSEVAVACCTAIASVNALNAVVNRVKYGSIPGSIEVLVDVLRVYGCSNATVAAACCKAIWYITINNNENQIEYGAVTGSMDVLVDVLRYHGTSNAAVAQACSGAIYWASASNPDNQNSFAAVPGSVEVLVDALEAHGRSDAIVAQNIFNFFISAGGRVGYKEMSESIDLLVDILEAHSRGSDRAAAGSCSSIIKWLATDPANHAKFEPTNVFSVLVDVLEEAHGNSDADTTRRCCSAIKSLAANDPAIRAKFGSTDVASVLVGILETHGNTGTEEGGGAINECCWAIANLCQNNDANGEKFNELKTLRILEDDVRIIGGRQDGRSQAIAILRDFKHSANNRMR